MRICLLSFSFCVMHLPIKCVLCLPRNDSGVRGLQFIIQSTVKVNMLILSISVILFFKSSLHNSSASLNMCNHSSALISSVQFSIGSCQSGCQSWKFSQDVWRHSLPDVWCRVQGWMCFSSMHLLFYQALSTLFESIMMLVPVPWWLRDVYLLTY